MTVKMCQNVSASLHCLSTNSLILQFSCFTKYNRMQSKHKQTKCDETLTDYSFLSRNHTTKSKNYFKKRYRIRH